MQSDGLVTDTLTVVGTGAATGFTVTYFRGAQNVTAQVKNGTYSIPNLGPGEAATLKMVVKLSQNSANTGSFLIKGKSQPGTTADVVKATVKAT
jgi:hypothetical protein